MRIDTAVLNRQALVLFNFWLQKQQNDKHIGDLSFEDFVEMVTFLSEMETNFNRQKIGGNRLIKYQTF